MAEPAPIHAVVTTLSIIEYMARMESAVGVSEIAAAIGAPKPRVFRHLRTLLDRKYVIQDPGNGKYLLSLRLYYLSQGIPDKTSFLSEARHVLPSLRDRTRQSVAVGQVEDEGVRAVEIMRYHSAIQITIAPGTLFSFRESAQGKIALAFGLDTLLARLGKGARSAKARQALASLREELEVIRSRGWAEAPEAVLMGVNAVAAPVFDANDALAGTIAVVGSAQYVRPAEDPGMVDAVLTAATEISARLGNYGESTQQ